MKKKITSLALAICLMVLAVAGATMAYFTDTEKATNTFTAGNVQIELTEAAVKVDERDNLVQDTEAARHEATQEGITVDYGTLFPGQSIFKDPTIENTGSEDAYLAAKVTITDGTGDIHEVLGVDHTGAYDNIDISPIVSGGLASQETTQNTNWNGLMVFENDTYVIYQDASKANGTYVLYFFMLEPYETGETVTLFDTLTVPASWDNAEMAQFVDLDIEVEAFATQTKGFLSCYEAMTSAFETEFSFN